jgi:4'-phosphopantetheinyl transferase
MRILSLMTDPPTLDHEQIHVWPFALSEPSDVNVFWGTLSPSERERAERFRIEAPRRQFVIARGQLRRILARYHNCHPAELAFELLPDGKPIIRDSAIHFNLTHSGTVGLLAIAFRRVGIDVEELRPMPNAHGLVARFFGVHEQQQFRELPDELRTAGFFRAWTCKEALMKAVGTGLQHVDRCEVCLDPRREPSVVRYEVPCIGRWRLHTWQPTSETTAALAFEEPHDS